jgi:uncharacterized protein (DUF983 family)
VGIFRRSRPADQVIDLTELERSPQPVHFGLPSACPECGHAGYLDHIDPFREIMYQHCPACFHKWEIARADVDAATA